MDHQYFANELSTYINITKGGLIKKTQQLQMMNAESDVQDAYDDEAGRLDGSEHLVLSTQYFISSSWRCS